ncbi:MAG: ribosomal protein L13e [Theionarchaea archaeon]|nr:MAG: hypothetical protein AYK18_12515 [Theionarchaea archaeon DG-70]MBU7012306.1 ribosomal protein L13e [Theionarchaea archaeon]
MEAQVRRQHDLRSGKGFSLSEIRTVGLNVPQARKLGIYVDSRRKTLHEFNVKTLEVLIEERQKQLEEEKVEKMEEKEKKKEKEKVKKKPKKKEEKKRKEKVEEKKEEKVKEKPVKKKEKAVQITEVKGVGKKRAEELNSVGISTVEDLLKADTEKLAEKTAFSAEYIEKLKKKARSQ